MTATATATLTRLVRKPRVKPARSISLTLPMSDEGKNGLIKITEGTKSATYFIDRIPSDFGEAFTLEKWDADMNAEDAHYHVNLNAEQSTCECKGFLRHHHCKHVEGLQALRIAGKL